MQEGIDNAKDLSAAYQEVDKEEESLQNGELTEALFSPRKCLTHRFTENVSKLVDLNLSGCKLRFLPESFAMLHLLSYLNLDDNCFNHLPLVVCELTNLMKLWLQRNFIKDIANNFGNLTKLKVLFLTKNRLGNLPTSCSNLNNLEILCLRNNLFTKIPECVTNGMKRLKNLDLSGNRILDLDVQPASIQITSFHANGGNHNTSFPMWILSSKYKHLDTVSLNKISFKLSNSCLPTEVSYVRKLSMKWCNFTEDEMEKIISRMVQLEELTIENTKISVRSGLDNLPLTTKRNRLSLKQVTVSCTGLRTIPEYINEFENLSSLDLDNNNIYSLPEELCCLHNLVYLTIDNNYLTTLPKNVGDLTSLKELKLRHNHLEELPESIRFLKALKYLDLYDNDLEQIPEAICELTALIGLDLDQNYFSIDDDYFWHGRTVCYELMRDALRRSRPDDVHCGFESLYGPKIYAEETRSPSSLYTFSYEEKYDDYSTVLSEAEPEPESEPEPEPEPETEPETIYQENENWDSEDSTDDFDPYEIKEPKKCSYSPFTFYKPFQQVYCPSEFHEISVITRVIQMLQNGTLDRSLEYEEGQFEDP